MLCTPTHGWRVHERCYKSNIPRLNCDGSAAARHVPDHQLALNAQQSVFYHRDNIDKVAKAVQAAPLHVVRVMCMFGVELLAYIFTQTAAHGEAVYSSFAQESAHADMCWHRIRGVIDRPSKHLYQHREQLD